MIAQKHKNRFFDKPRWHQIYYVLALIDIITILAALLLSQQLMAIYESSVQQNKQLSSNVDDFVKLSYIVKEVNEPGNRIFNSMNIGKEQEELRQNVIWFFIAYKRAVDNLTEGFSEEERKELLQKSELVKKTVRLIEKEAQFVLKYVSLGNIRDASQHMAVMDAHYSEVAETLGDITQSISIIQNSHFDEQVSLAKQLEMAEYAISAVVLIIIFFVAIYGHKLGLKMQRDKLKLAEALRESEELTKAKELFLANMSHEIRTPMNGILGMLQLIESCKLDQQTKMYLSHINTSSQNLLTLINDILDLSKLSAKSVHIEKKKFNLSVLLETQIAMFDVLFKQSNLTFEYDLTGVKHSALIGDEVKLIQIITNILSNAKKFTKTGGVQLTVSTIESPEGDIELTCLIQDTGIGISKEQQASIFDVFVQADSSTTRKYGGTGLGLSISKNLCELMGGSLAVTSKLGEGSCFTANVNFEPQPIVESTNESSATPIQKNDSEFDESFKILIAEDDKINQILISGIMKKLAVKFDLVSDGSQAIEYLKNSSQYDAVLMDCQMPVMDGYEASKLIRAGQAGKDAEQIPIIAVTANAMVGDKEKCFDAGMTDFITKPIDFEQLTQLLMSLNLKARKGAHLE